MWLWLPAEGAGGRPHRYPSLQVPGDGLQVPLLFRARTGRALRTVKACSLGVGGGRPESQPAASSLSL